MSRSALSARTPLSRLASALRGGLLLAAAALAATPAVAGDWTEAHVGGRRMIIYTPEQLEGRNAPLVISLHGAFGTAEDFSRTFPIYDLADRQRFRVAYVDGTPIHRVADHRNWNAGDCCGEAVTEEVDDITFLNMVIGSAVGQNLTFPENVFLFGHSNGAMMAYRYGCTHPDRIRGIVAVSGTLSAPSCETAKGVEVLHVHGTLDEIIPMAGGQGRNFATYDHRSTEETLSALTAAGAHVELIRVQDAHHNLPELDRLLTRQFGFSLPETVADFVDQYQLR